LSAIEFIWMSETFIGGGSGGACQCGQPPTPRQRRTKAANALSWSTMTPRVA
jgi:hypothetical protein